MKYYVSGRKIKIENMKAQIIFNKRAHLNIFKIIYKLTQH